MSGDRVVFDAEEVVEAVNAVLQLAPAPTASSTSLASTTSQQLLGRTVIEEIGSDGDDSSGEEANSFMEAADRPHDALAVRNQLGTVLTKLLNNPEVQSVVLNSLRQDEDFMQLTRLGLPAPHVIASHPVSGYAEVETTVKDDASPLDRFADMVGAGLKAAGEGIKEAGSKVGAFFVKLGANVQHSIRRATGRASTSPPPEPITDDEWWAGTIFSMAVAVLAVLVFKRAGAVRFARA